MKNCEGPVTFTHAIVTCTEMLARNCTVIHGFKF